MQPNSFMFRIRKAVRLWWFRLRKQPYCVECEKPLGSLAFLHTELSFEEILKGEGLPCPLKCKSRTDACQSGCTGAKVLGCQSLS